MEGDWLTYAEAAERLNTTPEAVRQKAIRGRWARTVGNDKLARVRLPDGWPDTVRTPSGRPKGQGVRTPFGQGTDARPDTPLIKALEAHVETLKAQLTEAKAQLAQRAEELQAYDAAYAAGLKAEQAKTEAEKAKAEKLATELAARDAQHAADLAAERARVEKAQARHEAELKAEQARAERAMAQTEMALAEFGALAERLDLLAAERQSRARGWWWRLVG